MKLASPPERPLLVFDGDCGFCRYWIARWRRATGESVQYAPYQEVADRFPEIALQAFRAAVQLVEPDGSVTSGAEAAFAALARAPRRRWLLWLYHRLPGAAWLADAVYRFVARHRLGFSRLTRLLWGVEVEPPSYRIARCVFLRVLGAVYLAAFVSLGVQITGLAGSHGILPAGEFLQTVAGQSGPERYWLLPTWCWLSSSDVALQAICFSGAALSCLVILGFLPLPCFVLMWTLYLSLATVCRTFLDFQWDALLLETGFLAIFLAPARVSCRLGCPSPPSRAALGLIRWLAFRLLFASGVVKLSGGDPTWWGLTALDYHFETQPLPAWTAWYAHQLPEWTREASTFLMFGLELGAPLLMFGPRRVRHLSFLLLVGLQLAFVATGNFGFFNLLSVALCIPLLDDTAWPKRLREGLETTEGVRAGAFRRCARWLAPPLTLVIFLLGCERLAGAFRVHVARPEIVEQVDEWIAPFGLVNSYGLFAHMTTSRPEIIVEGSNDGATWLPYEFKWKPGDLTRAPAFLPLHMPRLDWQMWFAALGDHRSTPWFGQLMKRLLEGSPPVLALLDHDPFAGARPVYLRAVLYQYHFTSTAARREGAGWWSRERQRLYFPVVSSSSPPEKR